MADKEFERDDPLELVGQSYTVTEPVRSDALMARTFIEEFALMGWPSAHVRALFHSPEYTGCHAIYRRRGAAFVDGLLAEVYGGPANG